MTTYGATNDDFGYSRGGLAGPNSVSYNSNSYGYGYSKESQSGGIYTHSVYTYNGVTTNYHSYTYSSSSQYYSSQGEYRSFPSSSQAAYAGEPAPPQGANYGYATSIYASRSLSDVVDGSYVDQMRTLYQHDTYASGYSTSYSDIGTSEFSQGAFVPGSSVNYSVSTVTNPDGYSTYTPYTRTY